jgi:pilus assembly protein Flp/PilA
VIFARWLMFARFLANDEEGQGLMEYALVLFLVAVVCIVVLALLGTQTGGMFSSVSEEIGGV